MTTQIAIRIEKIPAKDLNTPQVRRRLSRALRCRECKKAGGCKGCVIEVVRGKRVLNS